MFKCIQSKNNYERSLQSPNSNIVLNFEIITYETWQIEFQYGLYSLFAFFVTNQILLVKETVKWELYIQACRKEANSIMSLPVQSLKSYICGNS